MRADCIFWSTTLASRVTSDFLQTALFFAIFTKTVTLNFSAAIPLFQHAWFGQEWSFGRNRTYKSGNFQRFWLTVHLYFQITHFHQENPTNQHKDPGLPPPLPSEVELEQMIDSILKEDDFNSDGFIDYGEFLRAQKQREEQARMHHQQNQQPPPR